jgi:hypothetical protein
MSIKDKILRGFTTTKFQLKKYSPEILVGTGIATVVVGVFVACNSTTKLDKILDEKDEQLDRIRDTYESDVLDESEYTEDDYKNDLKIVKTQRTWEIVKAYAPAAGIIGLGITSIGCGFGLMKKRYLAASAAYEGLRVLFNGYRDRVKNELGEEQDKHFLYGTYKIDNVNKVVGTDENGNDIIEKGSAEGSTVYNNKGQYSFFFDQGSELWKKNPSYNFTTLTNIQAMFNNKLNRKGIVLLNEVLEALKIKKTAAGALVGWYVGPESKGDGFIDFGIFDAVNDSARNMAYGYEPVYLLNFNVDGIVYDKLDSPFVWSKKQ